MVKYVFLGIIQGLTEFLPISSSGHLVILQKILGINEGQLALILICHLGTLFSVIIFLFRDILALFKKPKLLGYVLLVTLITGIIGLSAKNFFESLFASIRAVSISLFITGIILIFTKGFLRGRRDCHSINTRDALWLGFLQGLSIAPGISRSGITVSGLLFRGLDREAAFRFSFLAGIPAIAGAFLLEAEDAFLNSSFLKAGLFVSFLFSFLAGLFSLWIFRFVIRRSRLHYFGYYCILAAVLSFIFFR